MHSRAHHGSVLCYILDAACWPSLLSDPPRRELHSEVVTLRDVGFALSYGKPLTV